MNSYYLSCFDVLYCVVKDNIALSKTMSVTFVRNQNGL